MKKHFIKKIILLVLAMTCISVILSFIPPVIYKSIANVTWNSDCFFDLWGTCSAGISSALITLVSVGITVKETRRIQEENNIDANKKIADERNERLKKERHEFINNVSVYVGKYITYAQAYFDNIISYIDTSKNLEFKKNALNTCESQLHITNHKINTIQTQDTTKNLSNTKEELLERKEVLQREINELENEKKDNPAKQNRLLGSECYFILKTQLSAINEAQDFLQQLDCFHKEINSLIMSKKIDEKWIYNRRELLIETFNIFKKKSEK